MEAEQKALDSLLYPKFEGLCNTCIAGKKSGVLREPESTESVVLEYHGAHPAKCVPQLNIDSDICGSSFPRCFAIAPQAKIEAEQRQALEEAKLAEAGKITA